VSANLAWAGTEIRVATFTHSEGWTRRMNGHTLAGDNINGRGDVVASPGPDTEA